mmetsp:Transcript_52239/g.83042  ORF Transcript_52239/g.83042 Transcript_52239/m.83042 type:complete len:1116 (-) Transcript_52239:156-3503(-)
MLERWRWSWCSSWTCIVALALAAPIVVGTTTCTQQEILRVQLPRPSQPEFAGFVVPSFGYVQGAPKYSDECLTVMVQGGGVGYDPIQELTDGNVDLAIAEGSYVAEKVQSGQQLKIIAGYYQKNGLVWIGLKDRLGTIASVKDLTNKRVGIWNYGYNYPFEYILDNTFSSSVYVVNVPQYPDTLSQLEDGAIDLATAMVYDELARPLQVLNSSSQYLRQSSDLYKLDPSDHGLTLVHNVLTVSTSTLNDATKRASIVKFLKVVKNAWHFCRANEAACAAAFAEYNEVLPHHLWQMREVNKFIFPSPAGHGLGVLSADRWNAMNTWLVGTSHLSSAVSADSVIDNSLVLEAGALENITVWVPVSAGSMQFCADYNSTNYRICQNFEYTYCAAGSEPLAAGTCKACAPGRYAPASGRMNTCLVCPAGSFATQPGMSECGSCVPGSYWDASSNSSVITCKSCPAGRFSNTAGASACRACALGFFVAAQGAAGCERCPVGRFMQQPGASACTRCQEGMATLHLASTSASACTCPQDTYEQVGTSACLPCPEGMICATNSKESNLLAVTSGATASGNYPQLQVGYWSSNAAPLFVYRCRIDRVCPGLTFETCGPNMKGTACGQCQDGYYRDGWQCLRCSGIDESAFNYPLLQVGAGPIVIFLFYCIMRDSREDWGNWWNEIVHLTYLLLTHYQIIGLLAFSFVQYPDKLSSVLAPFTYLVDLAAMLRLGCSKYADFRAAMIVKETFPALVLGLFFVTFCILYVVGKLFRMCRYLEKKEERIETYNGAIFPMMVALCPLQADIMINLYLTVFNTFYVAVCFMALQLFMCYQNPNGKYSILLSPEVICYDTDEWNGMLTEGIFALFFYIIAPISGFTYIVIIAPLRFHKVDFHTRWKCLFIKFKPDAFWWTVFQQLRILLLCLMLALSQQGVRQALFVFCLTLFYMALLVIRFPWRHRSTNLFDLCASCVLLYFSAVSVTFANRFDWLDVQIAESAVVTTFMPLPIVVWLVGVVCHSRLAKAKSKNAQAANVALAASCKTVFAKFVGLDKAEAQEFCLRLSEQDRDILRNAVAMIVAELLGHQPAATLLPPRLAHQDKRAGARTWAPGGIKQDTTVEPAKTP